MVVWRNINKPKQQSGMDAFTGAWAWPLTDKRRWCHQDFI